MKEYIVSLSTKRLHRLQELKSFYCMWLSEDPQDGTEFDCDVLDAIERLEEKYKNG